jgi:hypothetical protein
LEFWIFVSFSFKKTYIFAWKYLCFHYFFFWFCWFFLRFLWFLYEILLFWDRIV